MDIYLESYHKNLTLEGGPSGIRHLYFDAITSIAILSNIIFSWKIFSINP